LNKKYKNLFFTSCSFLLLTAAFLAIPFLAYAAQLEVPLPQLATGASVNGNSELPEYLKYIFDFGMFIGFFSVFLSLVWAGGLWVLSPVNPNSLANAKDKISGAISGFIILTTLYLIITAINPSLAIFRLNKVDPVQFPKNPETRAGVFFNNSSNCSDNSDLTTSSMSDLGNLKNRLNSVNILQQPENSLFYIAILYDAIDYSGMCQYINPCEDNNCQKSGCQQINPPFPDSASIHRYESSPNGDGVYLFRKSCFNNNIQECKNNGGGWQKISNSEIKNSKIYIQKLEKLTYNRDSSSTNSNGCTVPNEEQNCINWDERGNCVKRECPNLSGENITSIKINGNYLVLLVYFDEAKDQKYGPWSFCQTFPTKNDVTKNGPSQIKWESIRNLNTSRLPNYIVIIPVKDK